MSNAASRFIELPQADYLGPADVVEVHAHEVLVTLRGGARVSAELALALPYQPAPGDVLLVTGRAGEHYVIGVLRGTGRTSLAIQGDVEVRAVGGSLDLSGDRGVRIHGPEVQLYAGKLRTVAGAVVEQFTSLCQRVSSLLSVHAGQKHTVVDDDTIEKARSATLLTDETVTINGKQIHLG
jgi:Protein of unknown function (DUF3540)